MNIVRCDRELEVPHVDQTLRGWGHALTLLPDGIGEDDLSAALAECDLLLMCYTPIPARVIAAASRLRGIVKYGVGIDAIDIPAAHARGIAVVNVPTYAEETVAEGAFAMMIALAKRLPAPVSTSSARSRSTAPIIHSASCTRWETSSSRRTSRSTPRKRWRGSRRKPWTGAARSSKGDRSRSARQIRDCSAASDAN
jgi:lactate dehydrogenase-like 2-hydroxyacid dehydrogenase